MRRISHHNLIGASMQELDGYKTRLHELEQKFGGDSSQVKDSVKEIEQKFGKGAAAEWLSWEIWDKSCSLMTLSCPKLICLLSDDLTVPACHCLFIASTLLSVSFTLYFYRLK